MWNKVVSIRPVYLDYVGKYSGYLQTDGLFYK